MGVNLSNLVEKEEITIDSLSGKKLGIDSFNMLYQFLASIRGADGLPLSDTKGNVTSHLTGLFYRTINFVDKGLYPIYVFDGKPSFLKAETLAKRRAIRTDAEEKFSTSLKEGNLEEAKKMGQRALKLTPEMIEEAKELLTCMGIPIVEAPEEGEAQSAVMVNKGIIDGAISQDFDSLLFGATHLYRHVGSTGKRKVPGKNFYVDIKPEHISLENCLEQLVITREKLIWLGILVGTDFNDKFPKVGPKTALKLVREYDNFEQIIEKTGHQPEFDYKDIVNVFLKPNAIDVKEEDIKQKMPNKEKLLEFLVEKHDFNKERTENSINKFVFEKDEKEKQKGLSEWF